MSSDTLGTTPSREVETETNAKGITVELSYDMSKAYGERRIELSNPGKIGDVLSELASRFDERGQDFAQLSRVTAVAVNGVLINHRAGRRTRLENGDTVAFVKAASGG